MKREETIELNGKEYTLTFSRLAYIAMDQRINFQKFYEHLKQLVENSEEMFHFDYKDEEEIKDGEDPFADEVYEKLDTEFDTVINKIKDTIVRQYWILLNPVHKLNYSEVKEILKPYLDDENKFSDMVSQVGKLREKCIEIKSNEDKSKN